MRINFIVQKNEAATLTRGGLPTKLFDVVELILKNGGSVRGRDLKQLFPQLPALYSLLKSEPGILRDTTDGRVQQATSLWICVALSRDKVKFDSNEWNSRPVIDV